MLRNFHTYAATLHDRIYLMCGRFENLNMSVDGASQLDALLAQGSGCILLGSHLGSFERCAPWGTTSSVIRSTS